MGQRKLWRKVFGLGLTAAVVFSSSMTGVFPVSSLDYVKADTTKIEPVNNDGKTQYICYPGDKITVKLYFSTDDSYSVARNGVTFSSSDPAVGNFDPSEQPVKTAKSGFTSFDFSTSLGWWFQSEIEAISPGECIIKASYLDQEVICGKMIVKAQGGNTSTEALPTGDGTIKNAVTNTTGGQVSRNFTWDAYNGINRNFDSVKYSNLFEQSDGTFNRVEFLIDSKSVLVEKYSSNYSYVSGKILPQELPLFGGVYSGDNYNYIVYGQENKEESDEREVYRVVKYTKDWERAGSDSLYGVNTTVPFDSGVVRMCESDGVLYIRTCHKMYKGFGGKNHQANVSIVYDIATDKIIDSAYEACHTPYTYVSHSFNQFVHVEDGFFYSLDHGDAIPTRAIVLARNGSKASDGTFKSDPLTRNVLEFPGVDGDNYTGACVGGYEISGTHHLIAINLDLEDSVAEGRENRNIYILTLQKGYEGNGEVTKIPLTFYTADKTNGPGAPLLVKITNNCYMVLWEEGAFGAYNDKTVHYVMIDGTGTVIQKEKIISGELSDCQPIQSNARVIWYVTKNSTPIFYSLPIDGSDVTIEENTGSNTGGGTENTGSSTENNGGATDGSAGGTTSGSIGGATDGSTGGAGSTTDGSAGGSTGDAASGSAGGTNGGSAGSTTGGSAGSTTGGNAGGNTGSADGSTGGTIGEMGENTTSNENISGTDVQEENKKPVEKNDTKFTVTSSGKAALTRMKKSTVKSIVVPASTKIDGEKYTVAVIGANAFKDCTKAAVVTIPSSVTKINANAFAGSKITTIKISIKKGVNLTIDKKAFKTSKVKKIQITMNKTDSKRKNALIEVFTKAGIRKDDIKIILK